MNGSLGSLGVLQKSHRPILPTYTPTLMQEGDDPLIDRIFPCPVEEPMEPLHFGEEGGRITRPHIPTNATPLRPF